MTNSTYPTIEQAIRATTDEFLRSYVIATQKNDAKVFSETLADGCLRYIGPSSFLTAMGLPPGFSFTIAEYEELSVKDLATWSITECEIGHVTIDVAGHKSAATSSYTGTLRDGTKFSRNLSWFLDFNDDGTKIQSIYQLNDTQEAKDFRLKIEALQAEDQK